MHANSTYKKLGLQHIGMYFLRDVYQKIKDYEFIFMFVRDPYDRLVSAFVDKIENKRRGQKCGYCHIVDRILGKYGNGTDTVTFEQFLQFALDTDDPHWTPYVKLLNPCHLNFTFIGKYESREQDLPVVLHHLYGQNITANKANAKPRSRSLQDFYHTINKGIMTRVAKKYEQDFAMFDYDSHQFMNT